jgi:hypothetical protein
MRGAAPVRAALIGAARRRSGGIGAGRSEAQREPGARFGVPRGRIHAP